MKSWFNFQLKSWEILPIINTIKRLQQWPSFPIPFSEIPPAIQSTSNLILAPSKTSLLYPSVLWLSQYAHPNQKPDPAALEPTWQVISMISPSTIEPQQHAKLIVLNLWVRSPLFGWLPHRLIELSILILFRGWSSDSYFTDSFWLKICFTINTTPLFVLSILARP